MGEQQTPSYELTHTQTQIWIGQRLNPELPLYNMAFSWVFSTFLDADTFQAAWLRVVAGNEVLRTAVREVSGVPHRITLDTDRLITSFVDLGRESDPLQAFSTWSEARSTTPLPLDGPLVDSVLVNLGRHGSAWYLNLHHLITDARSSVLLYRQVAQEYQAIRDGIEPPTPLAPYYPTARALAAKVDITADAKQHWASRRDNARPAVPLYVSNGSARETASTRYTLELTASQMRAIDRLCEEQGFASLSAELSRFNIFATLLFAWLGRVSGESHLAFDAPVIGRPGTDARNALGLFIEMFPFCVQVAEDDSFRSLGGKCLEESFLFLQHALPGSSEPSESSAASIVLNYFPEPFGDFADMHPQARWVHPGHGDNVHALRLQVHDFDGDGCFTLHFDFNDQVLPAYLCRRSLEHFNTLLEALLSDPDRKVHEVALLTADESGILERLNHTNEQPLPTRSVLSRFDEQVQSNPQSVAVRQGPTQLTFLELSAQADALAATLLAKGVQPGDFVALAGKRSVESVIAILATLRVQAAYVPIDKNYPAARVHAMLEDSKARLVLTGETGVATALFSRVETLDIQSGIRQGRALQRPGVDSLMSDLAYMLYTSGSTGRPKGVLIEHLGLADYLDWAARTYVRGDRLSFPLFTSLSFDLTVTSLFLPLITGGVLEIYPESDGPVDSAIMDVVADNKVGFIKLTPSHVSLLEDAELGDSKIRCIVVGGEDFKTSLAASIDRKLHGKAEIYNEYGPTEAVVGCVLHRFDPQADQGHSVPIGRPADHVSVDILNHRMMPVPEGVPGELWVSRPGLARAYHNQEALTHERFLPHPILEGQKRYRTGDLVRWVSPGRLEYLGRQDRQLKISGFRIEPGEIEAALLSIPDIEQCAVLQRKSLPHATPHGTQHSCVRCGLSSDYPHARFDEEGVCSICRSYEAIKDHAASYFKTPDDLLALFERSRAENTSAYDCMMLLSGGKDSTYALCQLVDMGLSVYALTLDNGFISDGAKENIRKVTGQLGVTVEFAGTEAMNAIFRDSLARFSNVCQGCFKTLYTLSTNRAIELGIPVIVTGLSRGQMFETRLTEEMFKDGERSCEEVDAAVLAARKIYHRIDDEVARSLDVGVFQTDEVFEQIQFVDFYRYRDVGLEEVLDYLERKVSWQRPKDTGRSTNCLINDTGIFVHLKEKGYHNYALPYSWDVRLGHKTREAANQELNDHIDAGQVEQTLQEIGYPSEHLSGQNTERSVLWGFYTAARDIPEDLLRDRLSNLLPISFIPTHFRRLEAIPLTAHGKIDQDALPWHSYEQHETGYVPPEGPVEEYLAQRWQEELECGRIGANDHFFRLGGTSLSAMRVMVSLCREFDIELPLETVFNHPTLGELARIAEERILADVEGL